MSNASSSRLQVALTLDCASVQRAASGWRVAIPVGACIFLTMLPVTMLVPVLKEIVADRFSVSPFWTHAFMSINMVGAILAAPIGGRIADRVGRRKPILLGAVLCNAVLLWAMGVASSFTLLMLLRLCEGMTHIVALTSLMACASDRTTKGTRGRAMGALGACMMFGTTVGSPLGGFIGHSMPNAVFPIGAVIAALVGVIVIFAVRDHTLARDDIATPTAGHMLGTHRPLLVPYAYAFIDRLCVGVVISTFMLYLSDVIELAPPQRGMLMAWFMLPFAILCYPIGRLVDRIGKIWPMALGSLGFGVVFATYGFLPGSWLVPAMLLSGVLSATMFAPNLAMCADLAPEGHHASAFAGFNIAGSLGFLCGPLLAGALYTLALPLAGEIATYRIVFSAAGATEVICAMITLPFLLRLRAARVTC